MFIYLYTAYCILTFKQNKKKDLNLLEYADNELNLLEDNLVSIMRGFSQAGNH